MTKKQAAKAKKLLSIIDQSKGKICELRDLIRDEVSELEDIVNSLEQSISDFDYGISCLNQGIDNISELL